MVYIGVDLGGPKITAALFDMNGEIADSKVALLEGRKGEAVANLMTELISGLIKQHKIGGREKKSIGICVPGRAYSKKGTVWCPNIPEWDDFPLQEYISRAIPNSVICIESDRTCYILGEVIAGCAKKCDNAVFMAVGTGIGLGIRLLNGVLIEHLGAVPVVFVNVTESKRIAALEEALCASHSEYCPAIVDGHACDPSCTNFARFNRRHQLVILLSDVDRRDRHQMVFMSHVYDCCVWVEGAGLGRAHLENAECLLTEARLLACNWQDQCWHDVMERSCTSWLYVQ